MPTTRPPDARRATLVTSPLKVPAELVIASTSSIPPELSSGHGGAVSDGRGVPSGTPATDGGVSPWDEAVHREYLDRLSATDRAVLDSFVRWVNGSASWQTFFTFTWSEEYAAEHKGLFGPRGAVAWCERFFDDMGYTGCLVLSPEGHRWRDVWHVHGLAERFDWKDALYRYGIECKSRNGLDLKRARAEAVPYVMKYALKDGSEHQLLRLG